MVSVRARAKELLPSVLLTLLSIIQALALELLWSRLGESDYLWSLGWTAAVGWAQVAVMFLGILQVWIFYTSVVMRLRWQPSVRDSVLPFVIGIFEFTLVDLLGPGRHALWLIMLAAIFAVSTWESHTIFRRARRDPENVDFFSGLSPASFRDFAPSLASMLGLALCGALVHVFDEPTWLVLASLLLAGGALGYQLDVSRRYWDRTLADPSPGDTA